MFVYTQMCVCVGACILKMYIYVCVWPVCTFTFADNLHGGPG